MLFVINAQHLSSGDSIMENKYITVSYAARNKNYDIVALSRSGGVFSSLSNYILKHGGIVYGCVLEELKTIHIRAVSEDDRDRMRNSKYTQSDIRKVYKQLTSDVQTGNLVLFSGTPCQCAAIKKVLGDKEYDNLILVDMVCQGVASAKVWEDYCKYASAKMRVLVDSASFRNKNFGWRAHVESFYGKEKSYHSGVLRDLISGRYILRPSCYVCPFKNLQRNGDITIGDLWGIEKVAPQFNDNRGASLVLINSEKGKKMFEKSYQDLNVIEVDIEHCKQRSLYKQLDPQIKRDEFWKDYTSKSFEYIVAHYTTETFKKRLKNYIKRVIMKG